MSSTAEYRMTRADALAMFALMIAGAVITIWVAVTSIGRIVEALPNRDVPVLGYFSGTPAQAPIGVDGAGVPVELERARFTVEELPLASLWALVLQEALTIATVVVVVGALIWLGLNVTRGQIFSRANTRLVITAGTVGLFGYFAVPFFGNMVANGAFARISERTFDNVIYSIEPLPILLGAFVVGLAGTVFTVGERLQRDTAGLV